MTVDGSQKKYKALTPAFIILSVVHKHYKFVAALVFVSVIYFITARFGLTLNAVSGFATLVWAPTGIAIAASFLLGYRIWPAIAIAAFAVNVVTGASPLVALGIASGNTLEAVLGAYMLKRVVHFEPHMERVKDVLGLVVPTAIVATAVSATVGVTSLLAAHTVSAHTYWGTWLAWWVGDVLGAIVVAPLVFVWSQRRVIIWRPKLLIEASLYFIVLIGVGSVIFHGSTMLHIQPFTFIYLIFPVLIWIALRLGQLGSVTATFVASATAVWGTVAASHLSSSALSHRLLLVQVFMGITTITFTTLAALVAERERHLQQEQQLVHRADLLARQRTHLLALNRAKNEFIALASHQLRTPATSVKIYAGMLLGEYAGKLTRDQEKLLKTAYNSNERLLELIDVLLRVARVDSGKVVLKREKVDLAQCVNEVIDSYAGNASARKQTIRFIQGKRPVIAKVDKEKIRIVLENIIDNASKYSPYGKPIDVKLLKRNDQVVIAVKDSGVGIFKKDYRKLFKKFSRIDNPSTAHVDGTGLGLYWAKKIIALHRGSIEVSSKPNKGSTFTVTLPYHNVRNPRSQRRNVQFQ